MRRFIVAGAAALGGLLLSFPAEAKSPFDWSGFYIGGQAGYISGNVDVTDSAGSSTAGKGDFDGFVGGLLGGYDFQLGGLALGVEGDFGWSSATGHGTAVLTPTETYDYRLNWDAHIRALLHWPMGNFSPFVAGGVAFADFNVTESSGPIFSGGAGQVFTGGTIGGGVDVGLGANMIGRVEALYDIYSTQHYPDFSVKFNAWTVRLAAIVKLN